VVCVKMCDYVSVLMSVSEELTGESRGEKGIR
jgi:hypothetical protein